MGRMAAFWLGLAILSLGLVAPAHADSTVNRIVIEDGRSTLSLSFDRPIDSAEASRVAENLNNESIMQTAAADIMFCTTGRSYTDSNGTLKLDRYCNYRQIRWSYRISSGVQAIIVSNVNETGLWYWINGARQPRNAPHNVAKSYLFHGTMSGIDNNKTVDYQDYMTFRHNLGSGGTGSITFAGSIATRA